MKLELTGYLGHEITGYYIFRPPSLRYIPLIMNHPYAILTDQFRYKLDLNTSCGE